MAFESGRISIDWKKLKLIAVLIPIGLMLYFVLGRQGSVDPLSLVPTNAIYVIDSKNALSDWETLSEHEIWTALKTHPHLADLTFQADYLDSIIEQNSSLFKWFGDRRLLVSAHPISNNDYDFLFIADLKSAAKRNVALKGIAKLFHTSDSSTSKANYREIEVIHVPDEYGDILTITQIENQLVCSYHTPLVEQSIDAYLDSSLLSTASFLDTYTELDGDGIAKIYVQYSFVDDLLSYYMKDNGASFKGLSELLEFTSVDFNTSEDLWSLTGYTSAESNDLSYVQAVLESGSSEHTAGEILSNRTAWFLSFNFESFSEFRGRLEKQVNQQEIDLKQFYKNQDRIESLLDISVDRDLYPWVGNEVTVAQLRNNLVLETKQNAVILIKTSDVELARERLSYIGEQVKKRTPAKFKQIDYRNYQIQYLDIKEFFRTFFGEAFDRLDKPYYVIIDNYVAFSNSPYTLIGLIEDYEYGRNLANTNHYKKHLGNEKRSISVYVSPTNSYPALLPLLDQKGQQEMKQNKAYFEAFDLLSLTLTSEDGMFETSLLLSLGTTSDEVTSEDNIPSLYDRFATVRGIDPDALVVQMVEDGIYKKYYPNSRQLQIKAKTKDGILHGKYTEYFRNGKPNAEGKYKMGRKTGNWKIYDSQGNMSRKKY